MIVCICKSINSSQIRDAIEEGATDVHTVSRELGLGTGCGRCIDYASQMINKELHLLATEAEVA
ncbi:MAG: (2Fe-2S)-binding protein [Pseudomonadales bacterium]